MVRFGGNGRRWSGAAALAALIAVLAPAAPAPATAERAPTGRHVVTFTQIEKLEGEVIPTTVVCRSLERCEGSARIAVRGVPYTYSIFGSGSAARLSLGMTPKISIAPELTNGPGIPMELKPIRIMLEADGTGRRDVALAAVPRSKWERSETFSMMLPASRMRIAVANIRVTVHREAVTEQDR